MSALKEFANFILLNVANLAATYDRLLAENSGGYPALLAESRMTAARRLIKTVAEACEAETPDPLHHLFEARINTLSLESSSPTLPQPLAEIECLGQTLTPVVTTLEAGKFLWQMLAEVRVLILRRVGSSISSATLPLEGEIGITPTVVVNAQAEEQFHILSRAVEQSPSVVIITNNQGQIEYVNPKFCQITGYTVEEVIGQNPRILKSGQTSAETYAQLWQTISSGGEWRGELQNKKKNGDPYWIFSSVSPIKNSAGVITHFLSLQEDITERKQTEVMLEQLGRQNRLILQSVGEGIIGVDTEGKQVFVNPVAARMLDYEVEELIGLPSHATFHYAKADGSPYPIEECPSHTALIKGITHPPVDTDVFWRRDGTSFPVEYLSTPVYEEGRLVGAVIAFRDISKRKQAEQRVKESQQRLSLLVAQSPLAVIEWNLAFEVVEWNQAAERIFGYTREESLGRHAAGLLVPEEIRPIVDQVWKDLLIQQGGTRSTNENFTKDGRIITCEWYNTPLVGAQGELIGIASLVADITERKQLEQQVQQSMARLSGQIQAITEVGQQISGTLTLNDLFQGVVNLMQTQFGYYHAQIYTLTEGDMVLQAGTGEVGWRLKERHHKISLSAEQSLVVRTVWEGEPVLVGDVSQEPTWLPNPLLPETKAELAVPITLGAEVIGVLDVQSNKVNGLNEEDRLLLIGLCGQIAIAVESRRSEDERARLLVEAERRARREQTIREITEQMRTANSLQELARITARELGQRLSAGHAIVELGVEAETEAALPVNKLSNNGH